MGDFINSSERCKEPANTDSIVCPICGSISSIWCIRNGYEIYRCTICLSGFIRPSQIPVDLSMIYGQDYFDIGGRQGTYHDYYSEHSNIRKTSAKLLKRVETFVKKGSLIEVGCAMGFFLESARNVGWKVKGFEISRYASSIAKEQYNLDVSCSDFLSEAVNLEERCTDTIVALDVIEHLRKPVKFLEESSRILRKGGLLLLSTGNISSISAKIFGRRWRMISPPEHLFYFSRKGLEQLLDASGFDILDVQYLWKKYSLRSITSVFGIGSLGFLDLIFVPFNAFDVMYLFARRR